MPYKLVCTQPFHDRPSKRHIARGEQIRDQQEVARLSSERESHFVKVTMTAAEVATERERVSAVAAAAFRKPAAFLDDQAPAKK